jgi:hypothetical protein
MWRSRDTATAALLGLGDVFTGLGWPGSAHGDYENWPWAEGLKAPRHTLPFRAAGGGTRSTKAPAARPTSPRLS